MAILDQYRENLPIYRKMNGYLSAHLREVFTDAGILVAAIESRIKSEESLIGKLQRKGNKYPSIEEITDIVGLRIITFYTDDVDKVASVLERIFEIDWENSIDKRKIHQTDRFGYLSLHYICRLPEAECLRQGAPEMNRFRFEIQMRTVLQHAWANMNHDIGYKSGVEVPTEYLRNLSRLAGMLELADEQFSLIRTEINNYRRKMQALVASGNLDEVPLDGDTVRSYLAAEPFKALNRKIAAINQAEIQTVPLDGFLPVFKSFGFKTIGDIANLIRDYAEGAYQIACYQISLTDLDIISSSIGPQNLCIAYLLRSGSGKAGLKFLFDTLNGPSASNETMAAMMLKQATCMPFMNQ